MNLPRIERWYCDNVRASLKKNTNECKMRANSRTVLYAMGEQLHLECSRNLWNLNQNYPSAVFPKNPFTLIASKRSKQCEDFTTHLMLSITASSHLFCGSSCFCSCCLRTHPPFSLTRRLCISLQHYVWSLEYHLVWRCVQGCTGRSFGLSISVSELHTKNHLKRRIYTHETQPCQNQLWSALCLRWFSWFFV